MGVVALESEMLLLSPNRFKGARPFYSDCGGYLFEGFLFLKCCWSAFIVLLLGLSVLGIKNYIKFSFCCVIKQFFNN